MEEKTKADILSHANKEFPRECCGLIIIEKGKEVFVPCKNVSSQKDSFVISPDDYILAYSRGSIISVVHSHCYSRAAPSQIDLVSCETTKIPWHIVSLPNEEWAYFEPTGYKAPLVGRNYQYGVLDCYTLAVDWYKEVFGVQLNEHLNRPEEWWKNGGNIFMEQFQDEGFVRIDGPLKEGDIILMQFCSSVVNHVGVYLEPNLILHHLGNRLSTRDIYGGWLRKITTGYLRHSSRMAK